jgi:choline-glycine betaine transporter
VARGEERVTLPPWQNVVLPLAVITGVAGIAFTVTVVGAELAEQLLALLTVTENDPAAEALMLCVVAPVLQE